jgi:hypothetical protein
MHAPIACTLGGDTLRCRADELLPGLAARAASRETIAEGWRLTFAPEAGALARIADVVEHERRCCAFLRFALEVPSDGAPFVLTVDGPPGTGAFLAGLPEADATRDRVAELGR